jgi:putative transposase
MPEHVHLLLSEPQHSDLSVVMQVLKQRAALKILRLLRSSRDPVQSQLWKSPLSEGHVWQKRFYDFNVFTERKRVEKLRYMHRNPVERGLVPEPAQRRWSSYRHYANGEPGPVLVNAP